MIPDKCPCGETITIPSIKSLLSFSCGSRFKITEDKWLTMWNGLPVNARRVVVLNKDNTIHRATQVVGAVSGPDGKLRNFYLDDEPYVGKTLASWAMNPDFAHLDPLLDCSVGELSGWRKVIHGGAGNRPHKELVDVIHLDIASDENFRLIQ